MGVTEAGAPGTPRGCAQGRRVPILVGMIRIRRPTLLLGLPLALVPLVPIVAGIAIGGASRKPAPAPQAAAPAPAPAPSTTAPPRPPAGSVTVARVMRTTVMRDAPSGHPIGQVHPRTGFGSADVLWVVRTVGSRLGVVNQLAGNGRLGWIDRAATSLSYVDVELRVSLSAHSLTVLRAGRQVGRYRVAVGRPTAPTPTGRFSVTDKLDTGDPSGPYGCCILALSAVSPHPIENWSGGNRVAIHSTPDPSVLGQSVTHGCVRVSLADGRWLLDNVPLGTPVILSA
jgi:lipoprotein-anchoring transpeptidase ErfK/SrfK